MTQRYGVNTIEFEAIQLTTAGSLRKRLRNLYMKGNSEVMSERRARRRPASPIRGKEQREPQGRSKGKTNPQYHLWRLCRRRKM
jgi:hypothetical protein